MKLKNFEMEKMLESLKPILQYRNKVGYVAARNTRILNDTLIEYFKFKNELLQKYGTVDVDEEGNKLGTISIKMGTPEFAAFNEEYEKLATIEHEVSLMTLEYNETIDILSGEEILNIEWMLTE